MTIKEQILEFVDKSKEGVEIGPSFNPIAAKRNGYKTTIIDCASSKELKRKYHSGQDVTKIEEVDLVWEGETYQQLTNKENYYYWIIASHIIEHVPSIIYLLNNCDSILREDGYLILIIPDKRYMFDHFRPITNLAQIIDSLSENRHSSGKILEHYMNIVKLDGNIIWQTKKDGTYTFIHTIRQGIDEMNMAFMDGKYHDIHAWQFVPSSFRLIIYDLLLLKWIELREVKFYPSQDGEFAMVLSRSGKDIVVDRLQMLQQIEKECKNI